MSRWSLRTLFAAIAAAAVISAGSLRAQAVSDAPDAGVAVDETPALWFVELSSPPTAAGGTASATRADKAAFRNAAKAIGLKFTERYAYSTLFNGLAIQVTPANFAKLNRIGSVKNVYPVINVSLPPVSGLADPNLVNAITMTGADYVQDTLGFTGAGVKVGIIDSGIDYDHPAFGGNGTPTAIPGGPGPNFPEGSRVNYGYDFVGDAYDTSTAGHDTPHPDAYPDACTDPAGSSGEHGTHVAGIVGANGGGIKGVAPGVTFGSYRVFGCNGTTSSDIMLAAMEMALADGMQVVNMSIGSAFQWPEYPTAAAASRMVDMGVSLVCSIGNDGDKGVFAGSAPGVGSKVIGVASVDNVAVSLPSFTVSPDDAAFGYISAAGGPAVPTSGSFPLVKTGTTTSTADGCAALPAGSLSGRIVLIRRGTCSFYAKSKNAENAGAAGVVLYNNTAGFLNATLIPGTPPVAIPVVGVTAAQGANLDSRIGGGSVTLTWTALRSSVADPHGGLISAFSSYGLSPDLVMKPDISAPGGNITSTLPIEYGSIGTLSGTSMSSPHVAGAVALLLEAKPHLPAEAIRDVLQNSAIPGLWTSAPQYGFDDSVHRQGAGLLNIKDAILGTTRITPGKLSLGDAVSGHPTQTITIRNDGDEDVTYDLDAHDGVATGPPPAAGKAWPFSFSFYVPSTDVSSASTSVTVPAHSSVPVVGTFSPDPGLPPLTIYGGYVTLTPEGGGQTYRVPFSGVAGDYQSVTVYTPGPAGYPRLAKLVGTSLVNQPSGAAYTMAGDDIAYVQVHLNHQVRTLNLEVFAVSNGKDWHRAGRYDYVGRNSSATSFYTLGWDGTTYAGGRVSTVPNGQYVIVMTALKPLGDPANPSDVETWTSPVITVARP